MVIRGHISFLLFYIYVFVWLLEESQLQWPVGCCPSESLNSLYSVHSLFFHCCRLLVLCTICSFTIYQEGHCYIVHPGQHTTTKTIGFSYYAMCLSLGCMNMGFWTFQLEIVPRLSWERSSLKGHKLFCLLMEYP